MAAVSDRRMDIKPFSPDEARKILESLRQPAVFLDMTRDWPGLQWTAEHLASVLGERAIQFRIGKREGEKSPLFETQCSYTAATMWEFLSWTKDERPTPGPFSAYPLSEYWAYADYKYIAVLFQDKASMFKDVVWSDFGYPGRNGQESTLWVGTGGANTPCHLDTYGCNLVLQVQGRKKWHLFPPEDTRCLYPTRIPYEESSIFSQVDVKQPDLMRFPAFTRAKAHIVTLQPGEVLFVPRHWWHYVESVDPVTVSVNSWIEMEVDDEARVGEAITRTVVCAMKNMASSDNTDQWLNPTEIEAPSHEDNLQCLSLAVQAYAENWREQKRELSVTQTHSLSWPTKRDAQGQPKQTTAHPTTTGCCLGHSTTVPFGLQLVPVAQECVEVARGEGFGSMDRGIQSCTDAAEWRAISTNGLLEALVHPDVIALVTKLLIGRQMHGYE